MATNLEDKLKEALKGFPIGSVYGWLDSSVALHWIKGGGNYKQFVEIEFGRSRTRITSVGDTLGRRTTLLTSEAEVVIYSRQQTCDGLQIL